MNDTNNNSADEWVCSNCGATVSEDASICPKCGKDVSEKEEEDVAASNNSIIELPQEKTQNDSEYHPQTKSKSSKTFFKHIILILVGVVFLFIGAGRFFSPYFRPMWFYSLPFYSTLILSGIGFIITFIGILDWSYAKYQKDPSILVASNKIIRNYLLGLLLTFIALVIGSVWISALLMSFIYIPLISLIARYPSLILFIPIVSGFFLSFVTASIAGRIIWKNRGQPYFSPVRIFWFLAFLFIITKFLFMIFTLLWIHHF
jgi:hypothetical protein